MSDIKHPDNQRQPIDEPDAQANHAPSAERPLYRQSKSSAPTLISTQPLWWLLLVAILLVGILIGRYWLHPVATPIEDAAVNPDDSLHKTGQAVLAVEIVMPSQDSVDHTVSAEGTISAKELASVSARVNGVAIERVLVKEGDHVRAGQVLALFDTDAMMQQVRQAEAEVAEAAATLANARADAARILPLLDIDAISQQEADRYRTLAVRAQASLQASKAQLTTQRLKVAHAQVLAPVDGIISEKTADVGMLGGNGPLFTIIKDGVLQWRADMEPTLIGEIGVGTPVRVRSSADDWVMGQVSRVAPTADDNRQISIYASLADDEALRVGMYQRGEFLLGTTRVQTVPNSAIVSNDGYDYVMLVTDKQTKNGSTIGQVRQQRVTLGLRIDNSVVVSSPLPAKSQVVRQGGSFLRDGDVVRIAQTVPQTNHQQDINTPTGTVKQADL